MDFEDVSKEPVLLDNKSRALENMGKVYAKMGNYTKGTKRVFKCETTRLAIRASTPAACGWAGAVTMVYRFIMSKRSFHCKSLEMGY